MLRMSLRSGVKFVILVSDLLIAMSPQRQSCVAKNSNSVDAPFGRRVDLTRRQDRGTTSLKRV